MCRSQEEAAKAPSGATTRGQRRAGVSAGVRHLVQASAFGAGQFDKSFPKWRDSVEELVSSFRHPGDDFAPGEFHTEHHDLMMRRPFGRIAPSNAAGKDAPAAFADLRDVAIVAASVLLEKTHTGAVYSLTGGEALSYAKVAERISRLPGTPGA
jgi:uncharacterized protein YbjT (DUF2867 family)